MNFTKYKLSKVLVPPNNLDRIVLEKNLTKSLHPGVLRLTDECEFEIKFVLKSKWQMKYGERKFKHRGSDSNNNLNKIMSVEIKLLMQTQIAASRYSAVSALFAHPACI